MEPKEIATASLQLEKGSITTDNADDDLLRQMGYTPSFKREFRSLSTVGQRALKMEGCNTNVIDR